MATPGKPPEPVLREGEGSACGDESCLTLEGAFDRMKASFLQHHPKGDVGLLYRAFLVGKEMHGNQIRKSGEPYFFHPLAVAQSLADWRLDAASLACGMLHDVVEDTLMTQAEVRAQFGEEISDIVDGLTKMSKLAFTDRHLLNAENVRKLLVAMGKDVRVLLVKLADRLHNMKTLSVMEEEKRRRISRETMELYAPLANRLGMGAVRLELEDLAFRQLEPEQYVVLKAAVEARRAKLSGQTQEIQGSIQAILRQQGIPAQVTGRIKHLYGIWKKMGAQAKAFDDIHDWLAYRIICPDRASCYTALGLVHALYKPVPGRFKDYISLPKENGYQSIHTTVLMGSGDIFEVQIRTEDMHLHAERASPATGPTRTAASPTALRSTRWHSCAAWLSCTKTPRTAATWWPTSRANSPSTASRSSPPRAICAASWKAPPRWISPMPSTPRWAIAASGPR